MAQLSATNHKLDSSQNDTAKMQCEVTVRNIKLLLQYQAPRAMEVPSNTKYMKLQSDFTIYFTSGRELHKFL